MAAKKFRKSKFSCPVGGFVGERCLKHRASSMNDAHVRKSHAIDRFHAWVDRSRSHGFMRPCLDFHYRMGLRVDVFIRSTLCACEIMIIMLSITMHGGQ